MTGCGESYECGENDGVRRESPPSPRHSPVSSPRHSRENGNATRPTPIEERESPCPPPVSCPRILPPSSSPVIPVKTGIHASDPIGEQECPPSSRHSPMSSPRHSRENGNPRVSRPVLPPVIPVKTGIHASDPDHGAGMPAPSPTLASRPLALIGRLFRLFQDGD